MTSDRPDSATTPAGWALVVAAVVVVAGIGAGAAWFAAGSSGGRSGSGGDRDPVCDAAEVARRVLPSVVTIEVSSASGSGSGSGEVIDPSGIVLTNDHVIAGGDDVTVRFDDGAETGAEVVGRDPRTDLAVLRVDVERRLPALEWGDSDDLVVGEPVVALGAPLGLSGSVTTGVVSALGRSVPVPLADGTGSTVLAGAIQTDASINPGNSGGALVDCDGRLVGVNTAIATVPSADGSTSGSIGIGFAVPATVARPVAEALRTEGSVAHPSTGIETLPVVVRRADGTRSPGLLVTTVTDDGPAARAGVREGDVIVDVGGVDTLHPDTLAFLEATGAPGDRIRITVLRDGSEHDRTVTLRATQ